MSRVLSERERRTLRVLCDAVVPAVETTGPGTGQPRPPAAHEGEPGAIEREFFRRRASDWGVPDLIEAGLADAPGHLRSQFRKLLRVMDSRAANLLLTGRPLRISSADADKAERYLGSWGQSRLAIKRTTFHALKQVVTFLFYAAHPPGEPNPNWPAIGFAGTPPASPSTAPPSRERIRTLEIASAARLDADACVIGSGAGGSVAAAVLSKAGLRLLLLEQGGYYDQADYNGDEYEMLQRLSLGKGLFATADNAFGLLASNCLGGSTIVNWCTSLRPAADVREEWERIHGIDGVAGSEFGASLEAVERRLNVNTLESSHNPNNQVLADGARALGYRVETIPRNVRECEECGPCVYGCARGAKQDALATYIRDACTTGAEVLVRCRAERILARQGEVSGVEAVATDPSGKRHRVEVRCRTVILAGGAVFSPALLLRSGLGNSLVGTGLRIHPVTACLGIYDRPIEIWAGRPQTAVCTEFARVAGTHGFWIEASPAHPGLAATALPWASGVGHKRLMTRLANTAGTIVLVRDHGSGTVGVTAEGSPVVRYFLDPRDAALMVRALGEMGKIHLAAGAGEVLSLHTRTVRVRSGEPDAARRFAQGVEREGISPGALALFSAHLMGGLPMGAAPRRAAVDPSGQAYGVRNLFVCDGSVFPSAPAVNPMITIMAMAHRTALRIARSA